MIRYGRYVMISPAKVEGAERWAAHYGSMGIFISRLLPVVRHLIGIPAGIVRMNYKSFSLYTLLGSGLWCGVLCWIGIKAGNDEQANEGRDACSHALAGGAMLVLGSLYYFFVHRHMKAGNQTSPRAGSGLAAGDAHGPLEFCGEFVEGIVDFSWLLAQGRQHALAFSGLRRANSTAAIILAR